MLELIAVMLALAYVVLAVKVRRSCWLAAIASAALYCWIFAKASLYMESALQLFYIGAAIYGWYYWSADQSAKPIPIRRWSLKQHSLAAAFTLVGATLFGSALAKFTDAALPWLDSFTTVAALVTTWMVTQKILENWLYWIVIDAVSIYLYTSRGLDMTAALYGGYILLAVAGLLQWHRNFQTQAEGYEVNGEYAKLERTGTA